MSDNQSGRDNETAGRDTGLTAVTNNQIIHRIDRLETTLLNLDQISTHKLDSISESIASSAADGGVNAKLDALGSQLDSLSELLAQVVANQVAFFTSIGALAPPSPELEQNISAIRAAADTLKQATARDALPQPPPKPSGD